MKIKIFLIAISVLNAVLSQKSQVELQVPQSFAFMTVTHTRGGDYQNIQNHIERYANMDCLIVTELNIAWNNQIQPNESFVFNKKNTWKRPVNFYKTPNNSMDWRYKIPPQSKAEVFFIIDDDIEIDCAQLQRGFKIWQEQALGNIGPIVTYAVRFFQYTQNKGFLYSRIQQRDMFTIGLVGLSFMSRHFMDLYYSKIEILQEMRKIIRDKNNCDDIGINWLVQYFYPELETIHIKAIKGNLLAHSPAIAQSTSPTHYPYRDACIRAFTELYGVNVLRYKPINDMYQKKGIRFIPLRNQTVLAKKKYLEQIIQGKQLSQKAQTIKLNYSESSILAQIQLNLINTKKINENIARQATILKQTIEAYKNQLEQSLQQNRQSITEQNDKQEQQNINSRLLKYILPLLCIIVVSLTYKLMVLSKEKKAILLKMNQKNAVQIQNGDNIDQEGQ